MSEPGNGVLQLLPKGGGYLRAAEYSFQPTSDDVWVPAKLIRQYGLKEGAEVTGPTKTGKKGTELADVELISGLTPEAFQARVPFERLVAIDPNERFRLGDSGNTTMRIVELVAPIGKGTRGLIVAPPKAGKTQILAELAAGE